MVISQEVSHQKGQEDQNMIFLWLVTALDKSLFICNLLFALSVPLQCQGFSCAQDKLFFLKLSLLAQVPMVYLGNKGIGTSWFDLMNSLNICRANKLPPPHQSVVVGKWCRISYLWLQKWCLSWSPLRGGFEPWVAMDRFRKSAEPIRVLCSINTLLDKIMLSNSCPLTHFYLILYFLTHWQHVTNNSQVIPVEVLFFISINKYIQSGIIVSFIWETKIYCFSFFGHLNK